MGLSVGSVARIYCIQTIMNFFFGFSFEYYMPLGVNRFYFSLSGHCGFELGLGSMVGYVRWPLPGSTLFQNSRCGTSEIRETFKQS